MVEIIYKHTLVWKFCLCEEYWPSSVWFQLFFFFLNIRGYVFEVQHFFIDFYVMTTSILNTTHQEIGKLKCVPTTTDDTLQRILWEMLKDRQEFKKKKQKQKHFITQENAENFSLTLQIAYFPNITIFLSWTKGLITLPLIKVIKLCDKWQIFKNIPFNIKTMPKAQDDNLREWALCVFITCYQFHWNVWNLCPVL